MTSTIDIPANAGPTNTGPARAGPVRITARLDEPLSRWDSPYAARTGTSRHDHDRPGPGPAAGALATLWRAVPAAQQVPNVPPGVPSDPGTVVRPVGK